MGYRFCFGASGAGKSTFLHKQMLEEARRSLDDLGRDRTNYVLIVPEQYSLQTQKDLVTESDCKGILNVDVLTFGRLGHRLFEEIGASERTVLNEIGKTLLIRREAGKCEKKLTILGKGIHKPGMISEVKSILSEFMQYGIDDTKLAEMEDFAGNRGQGALKARLGDLRILFDAFQKGKADRFITGEETMDLLAQAIPKSALVRDSVFVLDGFTGFTPIQYKVLVELIRYSKEVVISLTCSDDGSASMEQVCETLSAGSEEALFYLSRKTVRDIVLRAAEEGLSHSPEPDWYIGFEQSAGEHTQTRDGYSVPHRFAANPEMANLERCLFRYPLTPYEGERGEAISVFETDGPEEEVRQICIQIQKLVQEKGYRYRDIAVVSGNLEVYGDLFDRYAARYQIPAYIDRTSKVMLTPLTEAITSALDIVPGGFSYESIFRYVRSGMSDLTMEEADTLENYCLSHGIKGRGKWMLPFDAETEDLRKKLLSELAPIIGEAGEGSSSPRGLTAVQRTEALYAFMVAGDMEGKMHALTSRLEEEGDFVRAKAYSQLYKSVIGLLEQIYDLVGDEPISSRDYVELLEAGFGEIRLGTLPQQVDRIVVGDIERTRLTPVSVLFLAGCNDGVIPKSVSAGGLLSDLDRGFLSDLGVELSPTPREQMYIQRFYLYLNMTKPSKQLYLSFSRLSSDGKSQRPSYLVSMLLRMYPEIRVEHPQLRSPIEQIAGVEDSITYLSGELRRYAEGMFAEDAEAESPLSEEHARKEKEIFTIFGYLRRNAEAEADVRWEEAGTIQKLDRLKSAAFKRYQPARISLGAARNLYGDHLTCGISRLETGANCYLRQFLQYGLQLEERKVYEVRPTDTGTVMHNSLNLFGQKLRGQGLSWKEFSREQGMELIDAALQEVSGQYKDLVLYSTQRNQYELAKMKKTLERTIDTLQYQLMESAFEPAALEMGFGRSKALKFQLGEEEYLQLTGRIDRLDLCEEADRLYVKILDYKSGKNELDEKKIRLGLQLQLILYMNSVLDMMQEEHPEKEIIPAAMLYYQMRDPVMPSGKNVVSLREEIETAQGPDSPDASMQLQRLQETAQEGLREQLRTTGMVNQDGDVITKLDPAIQGKSKVIPVKLGKNGNPITGSRVYTEEEFRELSRAAQKRMCLIAKEILEGNVEANPILIDRTSNSCKYCAFKDCCDFDVRIPGYEYRRLDAALGEISGKTEKEQ